MQSDEEGQIEIYSISIATRKNFWKQIYRNSIAKKLMTSSLLNET